MAKKALFFITLFFVTSLSSIGQIDTLSEVIKVAFYDPRLYEKLFFDYHIEQKSENVFYLPEGRCAIILPDTNFQEKMPDILGKLSMSLVNERKMGTISLVKEKNGTIYVSHHTIDSNMQLFVLFDGIVYDQRSVKLTFHTTSWRRRELMVEKYVSVNCLLKKKKSEWRIKRLRIKRIECCDKL